MAYLIMICSLKQSVNIPYIQKMLPLGLPEAEVRRIYEEYVKTHHDMCLAFVQLVRTAFLRDNGITFPEGRIFEDQSWLVRLMLAGATVQRVNYPFYVYNILDHRSSTTVVTSKRLMDAITVIYSIIDDIEAADPPQDVREVAEAFVANSIWILAHTFIRHAPRRVQELVRMRVNEKYAYYARQTQLLSPGSRRLGPAFVESQEAFEAELERVREEHRKAREALKAAEAANAETPSA